MFFASRLIQLYEKQIAELQAEKVELKIENARLQRLLIPGMRVVERQEQSAPVKLVANSPLTVKDTIAEQARVTQRPQTVKGWIQARDQAERLTEETERKEA